MNKILVIFSFGIIMSFIIYKITYKENNNLLIITDDIKNIEYINNRINGYNIMNYTYESINYKELEKCILNNDYIIIKDKKVYLNQLIAKSKIVIININKSNKCNNNYKNKLLKTINRFSSSKIIIIDKVCDNKDIDYKLNEYNI